MFFLQVKVPDIEHSKQIVTLLIIAIGGLVTALVALSLYIRYLHLKTLNQGMKFMEATMELKASVDACTKSNDSVGNMISDSMRDITRAVSDLHTFILQSTNNQRRRPG